jgi:hypothetical protein
MGWVKGSGLSAGDVIFSWRVMGTTQSGAFHHPFLVISIEGTKIHTRNCTSHESASYTTVEIPDAQKSGNAQWKTGASSYLVTSGEITVVATSRVDHVFTGGTREETVTEPFTQQLQHPDGSMSFKHYKIGDIITVSVTVPVHSVYEYYRAGQVTKVWRDANL